MSKKEGGCSGGVEFLAVIGFVTCVWVVLAVLILAMFGLKDWISGPSLSDCKAEWPAYYLRRP